MLVLADTACLAHETIELLGAKLIPAKESPERLSTIISAIEADKTHKLFKKSTKPEQSITFWNRFQEESNPRHWPKSWSKNYDHECMKIMLDTHNSDYLSHLITAHQRWVAQGLIEEHESILPECFRVPSRAKELKDKGKKGDGVRFFKGKRGFEEMLEEMENMDGPPKDIYAQTGYFAFDMSTGISKDTWSSAWASALLAFSAVLVLHGEYSERLTRQMSGGHKAPPKNVLALCRPPGHHCNTQMAGGYCYVNNAVVAAKAFQKYHVFEGGLVTPDSFPMVAILDLDFHHGNGTQDAFYKDPSVLYVSIHGEDEYPYYTGAAKETGAEMGKGYNLNLPLPSGSTAEQYMEKLDTAISRIQEFKPNYLLVSLGFDTFETDPLGCFKIGTEDYANIAAKVRQSEGLTDIPAVILLEGGYVVEKLGENMLSFLKGWES